MHSFAEFIAEGFHSEVNLIWNLDQTSQVTARFAVSSLEVEVSFEQREPNGAWYVVFNVKRGEARERTHLAFHIFNGVFQAVREFIVVREPETVVFAAKRDELAGVYQTYLGREQATLEELGYELRPPQRVQPFQEFTLKRIRPPSWRT